jgi:RNA polymerase sigma-32 factor
MLRAAMNAPFLDREEEHRLAVRWRTRRDEAALHRLASAHMRLVISVATRFRFYGLPVADLIQEGHVGLLEAAMRFDPDRDVRFSTYATWWIRAAIQDHVLRNWSIVRGGTSSAQKALFFNLRRLRSHLSRGSGGLSSGELHRQIALRVGVSEADVAVMDCRLAGPDVSLDMPMSGDDEDSPNRLDTLVDKAPLPDEVVGEALDHARRRRDLRRALHILNPRELVIIQARQLSEEVTTLETLGSVLGISKERVRQIEQRALKKLRIALTEGEADPLPARARA